jgi:hypothetical protein
MQPLKHLRSSAPPPSTGETRMKHLTKIAVLTMAFIIGQSTTRGQTTSDSSTSQKPVMSAERGRIEFLVGNFATATHIPPSPAMPKGATGKGTSVITWALDSKFLSIEEQSFNSLFGQYKGHGMLGFDSQTHQYVLSMFNNFGDHPTYQGNFVGDTLILQTKVQAPRGSFDQKLQWYKDGEAVKLRVLNDLGKGLVVVLEQSSTPVSKKTE